MTPAPSSFWLGLILWIDRDPNHVITGTIFMKSIRPSARDAHMTVGQMRKLQIVPEAINNALWS